ncbi:GntR family transcriptional regulator [Paenibacillus larvae]
MSREINNLQEKAYQEIRKKIILGEFRPGVKISEKELEVKFNIGRTPIREALIRLRREGLLYAKAQSGTYISKINLASADHARFVREHLEKLIMLECCSKLTQEDQHHLEAILLSQEKAALQQDNNRFLETDDEFHRYFYKLVGKDEIWNWMQTHNTHLNRFRWLRLEVVDLKWELILEQHRNMFLSVLNRNPEEAEFLTSQHLHMMIDEKQTLIETYPDYFQ